MNRLIELPDLAKTIQALPAQTFAALVRKVGVEDAGELIALATTEQLVQAFDEDLFVSDRAGERGSKTKSKAPPTLPEFAEVLRQRGADILFRVASRALVAGAAPGVKTAKKSGMLYSSEELEAAP